jgi:hypothetical protein
MIKKNKYKFETKKKMVWNKFTFIKNNNWVVFINTSIFLMCDRKQARRNTLFKLITVQVS